MEYTIVTASAVIAINGIDRIYRAKSSSAIMWERKSVSISIEKSEEKSGMQKKQSNGDEPPCAIERHQATYAPLCGSSTNKRT